MTNCNQQNIGPQSGTGKSRKSFAKAFDKALKDLKSNGDMSCMGGTCGAGGSCGYKVESISVDYRTTVQDNGALIYKVAMSGTGGCACV